MIELERAVPRRPFVPTVVEVAGAATCPRGPLLKLIYGASGEYNPGFAIGTVTHSVLAELGRIEVDVVSQVDAALPVDDIAQQVYQKWLEAANSKIEDSWRLFADARISASEGRNAVFDKLRSFSRHLAEEIHRGYERPDRIVAGHHIINLDLPLQGVPDEYRAYDDPPRVEIREFKSYGGSKISETNKLQACGYQLLLEQLYPHADFTIRVLSSDDIVNVRMTESRRNRLFEGISTIQHIYEDAKARARPIPQVCEVCSVNDACNYYFHDVQPQHIRRYLWRLRMETLEEKGLTQVWKWRSKILPLDVRIQLGYADSGYHISELRQRSVGLVKSGGISNFLPGDTVIVSGGDPLKTPSFTGEVSALSGNSLTATPYGDVPLGLASEGLTIDHYDVDLTSRQLRSIDAVHRATGRTGELTRRVLGIEGPGPVTTQRNIEFAGDLNEEQRQAVTRALSAPDYAVILGPPGTGKTAVIVETLIQLAREGKRALAVSVTNTAVDNLVEWLLDLGHRFGIRFGNWYKIRERAMEVALINLVTDEEDRALAAVEKMRTAAAVLTTCSSASLDLVKAGRFDAVLFEESSQIRMQDAFSALVQADKAVVIGDDKQLPPVSHMNRQVSSLLEIALGTLNRHGRSQDLVTKLRVQYRMRRQICDLINDVFYDGSLLSSPTIAARPQIPLLNQGTGTPQLDKTLEPTVAIALIDVEGVEEHRGYSILNRANLKVDSLLIASLISAGLGSGQIGVITPYKEQQRLLSATLSHTVDVGTVDSFQGQERDVVILDLVRANPGKEVGFTLDSNRLNVALSRAREKLVIVANLSTFQGHPQFNRVLDRIRSLSGTLIEHVAAEQLGIQLPEYRKKLEIQVRPAMVDRLNEPEDHPPAKPIAPAGKYVDIY